MSWRTVVISHTAKLDYQIGYLVVRGQETIKIHLSEIGILVVESTAVSMTAYLLSELVKKKIKVIFCDEKRNPSSELISYYGSHDTSVKIRRQMEWSREEKATLWTEIVSEKIRKQAELLEQYGKTEAELLYQYINEIELGDVTNREGHAAKVYFNALFGKDFTRTEECPINAALNYGYALILSCFNREIVSNGYITQIGLFHDNMFNPYNLSSDLMEPYRVVVDRMVRGRRWKKFGQEILECCQLAIDNRIFLRFPVFLQISFHRPIKSNVFPAVRIFLEFRHHDGQLPVLHAADGRL